MVSDAILFYDAHGPKSKGSLAAVVVERERTIRSLGQVCSNLNAELAALDESDPAFGFDAAALRPATVLLCPSLTLLGPGGVSGELSGPLRRSLPGWGRAWRWHGNIKVM